MVPPAINPNVLEQYRVAARRVHDATVGEEERARAAHENFNVFTTLLSDRDEVRLHTRFLHCLLNPKGCHDCGDLFLRLFLATIKESAEYASEGLTGPLRFPGLESPWTVEKEAPRGDYGRIDLLLEQKGKFGIAIENKIYAGEQERQLERYANYLTKEFRENFLVIYLTLDGKRSNTNGGRPYLPIAYDDHILAWLDKCLWETCRIIPINQVLLQYREVVRKLTGKTIAFNAMKQTKDYLLQNPDIIRFRAQIAEAVDAIRADFLDSLADGIMTELMNKGYTVGFRDNLRQGTFGSEQYGAFIITPSANSPLNRIHAKIWVENITSYRVLAVGIKFPERYTQLPIEDQHLLDRMNRILDQEADASNSRQSAPNPAWPTGWLVLMRPFDDNELARLIGNPAGAVSKTCSDICDYIGVLEGVYGKASAPPLASVSETLPNA